MGYAEEMDDIRLERLNLAAKRQANDPKPARLPQCPCRHAAGIHAVPANLIQPPMRLFNTITARETGQRRTSK